MTNYKNVKLEKSMYNISGKSFTEILESVDPSSNYSNNPEENLDAYGRQLKRFNIKISGNRCDTVEKFFSSSECSTLFPEYVLRAVNSGANSEMILNNIIAAKTYINSLDYRTISCDAEDNFKELKNIAEGAQMPETRISLKPNLVKLTKSGRMLVSSYEALKSQKIDVFTVALKQIGNHIATSQLSRAIDVLINGDGNGNKAEVLNVVKTSKSDSVPIKYGDLINLWALFTDDFKMNTMLVSPKTMTYLLQIEEFKNPNTGLNFQKTGELSTPLGANLYKSSVVPNNVIVALDKNYALEMVCYGDITVEHDKLIERQLERAAITATYGFSKICPNAVKVLKFTDV